jgi:FAD/FMN-containing dehydrogenase
VPSPWIWAETERVPNLQALLEALDEAARDWPLTMSWVDCLKRGAAMGRGIVYRGRWAEPGEAPAKPPRPNRRLTVPFDFPGFLLNRFTMGLFNFAVYHSHIPRQKEGIQHPEAFFHPLDKVLHWNRGYGRRGFTQLQCVLPKERGIAASRRFLELLTGLGVASFLCVIKDCGEEGEGLLSFPRPGTSIAVDIPVRRGTAEAVAELNRCIIEEGGRIYLAKDTFTTAEHFRAMEPRLDAFLEVRRRYDPEGRLGSVQSVRLFGDSG